MNPCKRLILTICLLGITLNSLAQPDKLSSEKIVKLEEAKPVERDMVCDDIHKYGITLEKGRFLYATVVQHGMDIVLRVIGPDGTLLEEVDSPTGSQGTETVILETEQSGDYTLEIVPFDPLAQPGKYVVAVEKIAPAATTVEGKIDQLFVPWDKNDSPGAAVAVVRDGNIIFSRGYGMANLEYDIPITPQTVFHMASVSKQFTAFAIAKLAQQGLLSLDDTVQKYIPEIPDFGKKITIRHLVHHISGLRDQWNLLMLAGWRLDDVITREHILSLISHQKELNFEPGSRYMYSNTGYTLMAEIVARVSGKSFAQWTQENIFDPLKMSSTLFYDDHEKIVKNRAYSYSTAQNDEFRKSVLSYANVGATSLFTTVEDLARWATNFEDPVAGDKELIIEMERRGVLNSGDTISYAFGQGIGTYKGLPMIGHSGGDAGYRTYLGRFPGQKFSVMVLSNFASFNPRGMALRVADIFLEDLLVEPEEQEEPVPGYETVDVDPAILETYAGLYEVEPENRIRFRRNGKQLEVRLSNAPWNILFSVTETRFLTFDGQSSCTFDVDESGEVKQVLIDHDDKEFSATRVRPYRPTAAQLQAYAGTYYSEELQTAYYVSAQDSVLLVQHQRIPDFTLVPDRRDVFNASGFYGQYQFVRNENNEINGFRLNFGRVQRMYFKLQN